MLSFLLRGGEEAAVAVVSRTRLFTLAESLGAVESLIEHPARMTHASAAGSPLEVDPGLVRLSVGIETEADLLADLGQALEGLPHRETREGRERHQDGASHEKSEGGRSG
jgi:cystathionine gamma-synthase